MNKDEIQDLINKSIRSHEIRVGWISGLLGLLFVFGIMHSIWLMKNWIQ